MGLSSSKLTWLGVFIFFGVGQAKPQVPERTLATFADWTVICTLSAENNKICDLVHSARLEAKLDPISQITITRSRKTDPFKLFIQVPPNVWFQSGIKLLFEGKETGIDASFRWCTNTRCLADAELKDEVIAQARTFTQPCRLEYKEATQRDVAIPVSFKGFGQAFEWMEKQQ